MIINEESEDMFSKDIIERYSKLATASVADAADKVGRTCYMT